jgi:hypothetical protein
MSSPGINRIERRQHPREVIGGDYVLEIDPGDGHKLLRCFIRDISEEGAGLQLPEEVKMPDRMLVRLGNVIRPTRLIWQKERQIGIEFLEMQHAASKDPLAGIDGGLA